MIPAADCALNLPAADVRVALRPLPRQVADLPRPSGLPLIGNLHQIRPSSMHLTLERWYAELGGSFSFNLGGRSVVVIADGEALQSALRSRPELFRRGSQVEAVFDEMGANGVFSVEGEAWRPQRKLIMQALSAPQLRLFHPTLVQITERLHRHWHRAALAGRVVEMNDDLVRYTVDVTTALAFGEDPNTLEHEGDVIQNHLAHVFPTVMRRVNSPWRYWRHFKLPSDRRFDRAIAAVHAHVNGLIARARERLRSDPAGQPRNVLEAMLVEAAQPGSGLGDAEVVANVITLLLAGEDTTAHTLAWTLHHLALNPHLQDRLHDIARDVMGQGSVCASQDDLRRFDEFEACATEATRLRPIVPLFYLETIADTELCGIRLPARQGVLALLRPPMLDAANFSEPQQYRPQRWLREVAGCPRHAGVPPRHESRAYAQFGAGPRVCPGRHLAGTEIRLVLAMLMRHFRIEHAVNPASIREVNAFTMMPSRMPMRLRPRR